METTWKTLPSWAVVATADHAIHPQAERDMANRAVAAVIVRAVKAIK